MSAKVTWGHGVLNAIVAPRGGRILHVGSEFWTRDTQLGYPAWGYNANVTAHDEEFCAAALGWLYDGPTNILLCSTVSRSAFESYMVSFAESLGHTVTVSGSLCGFGGLDPTSYGMIWSLGITSAAVPGGAWEPPGWVGACLESDVLDYFLSSLQRSALFCQTNTDYELRYGFQYNHASPYQGSVGSPEWLGHPFDCAALGVGEFQHSVYPSFGGGSFKYDATVMNTMGGVTTLYNNSSGEPVVGTWVQ